MKKIILIVLPLLLIAGTVLGLAFFGILNIPGITKPKANGKASKDKPMDGIVKWVMKLPPPKPKEVAKAPTKKAPTDLTPGDVKVATLWNEIAADKLAAITEKWAVPDLARILVKMDEEKVSKYLAALKPERAALISKEMRTLAAATAIAATG